MQNKEEYVFGRLFKENLDLNREFYSTGNSNRLKGKVGGFMDKCVKESYYVSDIHLRQRIRNFISSLHALVFPDERPRSINLEPPKGDKYTSSWDKPPFIELAPLPKYITIPKRI